MTTRIGLVSDTHIPMRCHEVPPSLFTALEGVDLLLHAGDVGELSVLDDLGKLAPVIAVHGNDDSADSRRSLPYRCVVACAGVRILLWHSHYEDRQEEFLSRQGDAFAPKLERIAQQASDAGASIAVFGHWHIPLVGQVDGVTMVNPGAVASGNAITRQLRQTVALLEIDGAFSVRHIDLAHPHEAYEPGVDLDAGFKAALARYSDTILSAELLDRLPAMLSQISDGDQALIHPLVLKLAHRVWDGEFAVIDSELLAAELRAEPSLTEHDKERFAALLE